MGFPGGTRGKEPTYQCRRHETQFWSLAQEDHLEEDMATIPLVFPGKFHEPKSLVGYNPWGRKELDKTKEI